MMTEEEFMDELRDLYPKDLLSEEAQKQALESLNSEGRVKTARFIKEQMNLIKPNFSVKSAQIYIDTYYDHDLKTNVWKER